MTFTPGIPASGQSLGSSRTQVLNNFAVLRSTLAANHIDVNNTGAGKHNLSDYVVQATSPATATNEIALYSRSYQVGPAPLIPELFIQKENQLAGAADIVMSRLDVPPVRAFTGNTFLPGGIIMQWFTTLITVTTGQLITFPIPFTTTLFGVWVQVINNSNTIHTTEVQSGTNINFILNADFTGKSVYIMALGD